VTRLVALFLLAAGSLAAIQHSGSVRAADQFIPGATVTARQGGAKVVAYTDENGRYTLDLTPGVWEVSVEMFGFKPKMQKVDVGNPPDPIDWTLEVPRYGEKVEPLAVSSNTPTPAASAPTTTAAAPVAAPETKKETASTPTTTPAATPAAAAPQVGRRGGRGQLGQNAQGGRGRGQGQDQQGGRGGRGFQNAQVQATEAGTQALAEAAMDVAPPDPVETDFVVRGSDSGGAMAGADEQQRRDRTAGRGGPGGRGGQGGPGGGIAEMAALSAGGGLGDPMGLNTFGAAGVQNGFGDGMGGAGANNPGGFGGGGGGRGGGGFGPGGGGGGGRGGGGGGFQAGGGGGGRGGQNARNGRGGRGPGGVLPSFGNRRRDRPTYNGNLALNARNSVLDAKPYSLNGQNAPKPSYASNQLSATLGGPLRIPKIYSNDRLLFQFSYTGSRARNPYNSVSTVPTEAEREGDFSQAMVASRAVSIYDPLNGSPFPGNLIPSNRFNPASAGLLKYFPAATYPQVTVQNYQIVTNSKSRSDNLGFRQNIPISRKDRLNFSANYQMSTGNNPTLFGFRDTSDSSGLSSSAGWSHSFKPRFNSNFTWNFSRSISKNAPFFAYSQDLATQLGITGTSHDPIAYGPPSLSFTNFGGLSDGNASTNRNQTSNLQENLTYVYKRTHNITGGLGYRRLQQNPLSYANSRGSFSFSGLLTSGLDANKNPLAGTGLDFADFLLGYPQSSSLQLGAKSDYFRSWSINWFAQDDWRIKPNLSFNLGLRYEYFSPYTELFGRISNLDLNSTITAVAVVTPSNSTGPYSGNLPSSLLRPDTNNYSPRFGFAWKPSAKKPLMFRGGYSIFFNGSAYGNFVSRMSSQPPFIQTASLTTSLEAPLTIQNGFPATPSSTVTNTYAIDPNYRLGYAQTWTFAVQESLPHNSIVELEYIGTKGTALDITRQPNRATPGQPLTAAQRLQIGNATGFTYETAQGSSIMHMAQVRLTRRLTRGLSAVTTYAFQKSLDNASSFGGGGGTVAQNDQNLRLERGLSTFDQRHHLTIGYTATSPVGGARGFLRGKGWTRKLLEGWMLNGNFNATSGTPLTARVSGNLANTGGTAAFGSGRAEASGLPIDGDPYFNLAAFTLPPAGQYGNAGRNTIPGLFRTSLSAGFGRAFRFAETRRQLQLRISTNNTFNHVTITNIGTTVNSSTYGLPTGASQTRTVNLTLRFNF
jgi:hypothetical protein